MDNTTRYVFPTKLGVGIAPRQGVVGLIVKYKLSASEPEEFEQRYALAIEQAKSIAQDLLEAVEEMQNLGHS